MSISERDARMGLCALQPLGRPDLSELVQDHSAREVWHMLRHSEQDSAWVRKSATVEIEQIKRATQLTGARFLIPGDPDWPGGLDDLGPVRVAGAGGAPLGVWVKGDAAVLSSGRSVALVGSRAATSYGSHVATELAADLGLQGRPIVSGLAYGIDAAAHRGALAVQTPTIAIMACGIDIVYPVAHTNLLQHVCASGAVVTEAPPGARPLRASFLARNRLIAALSQGVVVVEAAARSGARNTASWANALGRTVMAVPGNVTSSMSESPHWLIQQSEASLVTDASDVERLLGPLQPELEMTLRGRDMPLDLLREDLREVREVFSAKEALGVGELCDRTGKDVVKVLSAVSELTEAGWLEEVDGQQWRLSRPRPPTAPS